MKRIPLTRGQWALVDDDDYYRLLGLKWRAHFDPGTASFYAVRSLPRVNGKRPTEYMARVIMNAMPDEQVDHISHETLDNQKRNLRRVSIQQNRLNLRKYRGSSSQFKGVYFHKASNKWMARIRLGGRTLYLGLFHCERDAADAYDAASIKFHGEFGLRNTA